MWLARDENDNLYLFPYGKPHKGVKTGIFYTNINPEVEIKVKKLAYESFSTCNLCIRIFETDDRYKDITWENSPVELKSIQENNIREGEVSIFANCITLSKVLSPHFSKKRVKVIIIEE